MTIQERITEQIRTLPEPEQREVLDFVEFIKSRRQVPKDREIDKLWSTFSLDSAMSDMEDEDSPYTLLDLKESFR